MSASPNDSVCFLVKYNFVPDMHYRRSSPSSAVPIMKSHIAHVEKFEKSGGSLVGGTKFPNDGAYLFIQAKSKAVVEDFVQNDPFRKAGLVVNLELNEVQVDSNKSIEDLNKTHTYRP